MLRWASPATVTSMNEIDLSAVELLQRYRAKTLSPAEVFAAVEKHIARWEPHLKALYAYDPETARAEAAAATQRWTRGSAPRALVASLGQAQ